MQASTEVKTAPYPGYRTLWIWLALGWVASGVDRTITGPVTTYMIDNKVPLLQGVENPFAVGGLVGSLLFAGYMLMQFPGGYVGDRLGHRTVIVISIIWAGVATILSGLVTALIGLVALRVITGLGAGLFYSNDRSVITEQTPFEKRSLGMGFVITGLAIGITLAFLLAPPLIGLGTSVFGAEGAWRMPFIALGVAAVVIGFGMHVFFKGQGGEHEFRPAYATALARLGAYAAIFLVAVVGIYFVATRAGLPEWGVALLELGVALLLVGFIFVRLGGEISPVLYNRDLFLIYIAAIAILWNLWFFGFWSVSIIADAAQSSFLQAALTAAFNAGAGILGFRRWLAGRLRQAEGLGPQDDARVVHLDPGSTDSRLRVLHHERRAVRARAGRLAVYREPLLQRLAAHVSGSDRGPCPERCIPRGGVRPLESDRGDGSRPLSGHQRHAAGCDG